MTDVNQIYCGDHCAIYRNIDHYIMHLKYNVICQLYLNYKNKQAQKHSCEPLKYHGPQAQCLMEKSVWYSFVNSLLFFVYKSAGSLKVEFGCLMLGLLSQCVGYVCTLAEQAFKGRRHGLHPPGPSAAEISGWHSQIRQCLLSQVHFEKAQRLPFPSSVQPFLVHHPL